MSGGFTPSDQAARTRISERIEQTLFVEAGAGTGKTTSLVGRIVSLVKAGNEIAGIAAITFTEAAASELRDRVRRRLEEEAAAPGNPLFANAILNLDRASIQTLHSFAGSLLREKPLEAGLPPGFEVVEEIESGINFEERWQEWLDQTANSSELSSSLIRCLRLGLKLDNLKGVAMAFHANYDLLPDVFPQPEVESPEYVGLFAETMSEIESLLGCSQKGQDDPLFRHCERLKETARRIQVAGVMSDAALVALSRIGKLSFSGGRQADWDNIPGTKTNACADIKGTLKDLADHVSEGLEATRRQALMPLLESLRRFVLEYVSGRKREGKAEFQDLLVWARDMLKTNPDVRRYFQQRFSHILIDEFQDTDPIQAEIAFYLAEKAGGPEDCAQDWKAVHPVPGKLFVVGDPKQSIYRFRRADITAVEEVKKLIAGPGETDRVVELTHNFRSQNTIIDWVNVVFQSWMQGNQDGTQASYIPLVARWEAPDDTPKLGVHFLGAAAEGKMIEIRQLEAADIARIVTEMTGLPWKVRDENSSGLRPARYRDICVLMPTRTGLQILERALDAAGVPYRVESQSMVLGTEDVRELLSCLRAIDAPSDQIALVAALRSSAFAISDVELLDFVEAGGNLDYTNPGAAAGPVKNALELLAKYHADHVWKSPAQVTEEFIRERMMEEVCFGRARPRERLRRLQFVVEKARTFAEIEGSSLRSFLDWIELMASENARMVEVPVPEADEDAVRIMTIHAAKGLEFPVTILMGLGSSPRNASETVIFNPNGGGVEVRVGPSTGPQFVTSGYDAASAREKTADQAEQIRLMYVAATRARDHLVVSLHRRKSKTDSTIAGVLERICAGHEGTWNAIEPSDFGTLRTIAEAGTEKEVGDPQRGRNDWIVKRNNVLQGSSRPASMAVTTITRVEKGEAAEEYPHRLGRGGTSLGRAVHSVLQTIDLASRAGLTETSRAQAENEGIPDQAGEVEKIVERALGSSVVQRAVAATRYFREVFVSFPLDGVSIEGFIDLLFEEDGGLVIADYKTDAIDEEPSESKREQYSLQAGIYALAVNRITGRSVKEVILLFLRKPLELRFTDTPSLMRMAEKAISRPDPKD